MNPSSDRESIGMVANPAGLDGIEYVEYATTQPQALGQVLETMGFQPVARHRSREVLLYRQGAMNVVVNTRGADAQPRLSALALRVRDARAAHERMVGQGAWDVPMQAQVMELNIPAIRGPGGAQIYFVDRWREFSIYDVDFTFIPGSDRHPPAVAGLHWFGLVQYIGRGRTADWVQFYGRLLGCSVLSPDTRFGILPAGTLLQSPCPPATRFYLQLVEPGPAAPPDDDPELFHRIGFGTADVPAAVAALQQRGVEFVASDRLRATDRGAITRNLLQTVVFELVHDERAPA